VKILIGKLFVGHFQLLLKLILLRVESWLLQIIPFFCIPSYNFPFSPILLGFPAKRLPAVAGRGGVVGGLRENLMVGECVLVIHMDKWQAF